MPPHFESGSFKIISRTEGNPPIGCNLTRPAFQFVRINEPVQHWVIRKHENGKYRLSIGGYPYTGVKDGKVIVSIHAEHDLEWEISYHEAQETYTIARADDNSVGWTVSNSGGSEVEVKPIISTRSLPPHFLPIQLFAFERFK